MRELAQEFGADPAATDCARVMRVPGFVDHKRHPTHFVRASDSPPRFTRPIDSNGLRTRIVALRHPKANLDRLAGASCDQATCPDPSSIGPMPNVPCLAEILQNALLRQSLTIGVVTSPILSTMPALPYARPVKISRTMHPRPILLDLTVDAVFASRLSEIT